MHLVIEKKGNSFYIGENEKNSPFLSRYNFVSDFSQVDDKLSEKGEDFISWNNLCPTLFVTLFEQIK